MIEKLEAFDQFLVFAGFRGVKIVNIQEFFNQVREKTHGACVQFFDASLIAGPEHLRFAALNALTVFKNGLNISNSLAIETLLYASAQSQISSAIELVGIKHGTRLVVVLILADSEEKGTLTLKIVSELLGGKRDDSVIELSSSKGEDLKRLFGISNTELEAKTMDEGTETRTLLNLVLEHMALLATER